MISLCPYTCNDVESLTRSVIYCIAKGAFPVDKVVVAGTVIVCRVNAGTNKKYYHNQSDNT
jgi:hypothetical protein